MDTLSFEQIYKTYRETIVRYLQSKYSHTHHDAEELADDVFLTLYEKWNTLDIEKLKLLKYLYETARHKSQEFYRKKNKQIPTISLDELLTSDPEYMTLQDIGINMGRDAPEYQETLQKIRPLLTGKEKEIFEHVFANGEKISTTAARLKITPINVRVRCYRIRKKCCENKILKC